MNDEFHNPYHFVPVKPGISEGWWERENNLKGEKKHYPPHGCHSRYVDCSGNSPVYNGRIICRLTTETPIFIGAQRYKDANESAPAEVAPFMISGQPAIPATSLRGMISSIAEAASHSALRVLEDRALSHRMKVTDAFKDFGEVRNIEGKLVVVPLSDRYKVKIRTDEKILVDDKKTTLRDLARGTNLEKTYYFQKRNRERPLKFSTTNKEQWIRGKFRVMDALGRDFPSKSKHKDYFVEIPKDAEGIEFQEGVIERFEKMADERSESQKGKVPLINRLPYHPLGVRRNFYETDADTRLRLKPGDIIYYRCSDNKISDFAYSAIWRKESGGSVFDYFRKNNCSELLPFTKERDRISPAEMVFGFVEIRDGEEQNDAALAYAGRVRFSNALWTNAKERPDPWLDAVTLKILDSPKPPSPALYFCNRDRSRHYIDKTRLNPKDHIPQGRKFYLHHKARSEKRTVNGKTIPSWQTHPELSLANKKQSRLKQKVRVTPISKGVEFKFRIDFDNLNTYELGMLCYALQPNDQFRHKIGMGKSLGLGSVRIEMEDIKIIDRKARYWEEDPFAPQYRYSSRQDLLETTRKFFEKRIDEDIKKAIELIGNPEIKYPVHTPLCRHQWSERDKGHDEQETFKWFSKNQNQQLQPITGKIEILPTLKRN